MNAIINGIPMNGVEYWTSVTTNAPKTFTAILFDPEKGLHHYLTEASKEALTERLKHFDLWQILAVFEGKRLNVTEKKVFELE